MTTLNFDKRTELEDYPCFPKRDMARRRHDQEQQDRDDIRGKGHSYVTERALRAARQRDTEPGEPETGLPALRGNRGCVSGGGFRDVGYPLGWVRQPSWNARYSWMNCEEHTPGEQVRWFVFLWGNMYGANQRGTEYLKLTEQDKAWYKPQWSGGV